MEDNIIEHGSGTVIMNGGNPLPGCPADWDEAKLIEDKLNDGKDHNGRKWSFDCGFKLDFDGPIIIISSRFYPPKTHYGNTWDGRVSVMLYDTRITEKKFDCATLDELKVQVEDYVKRIADKIRGIDFSV
jgi:hypothetical protein